MSNPTQIIHDARRTLAAMRGELEQLENELSDVTRRIATDSERVISVDRLRQLLDLAREGHKYRLRCNEKAPDRDHERWTLAHAEALLQQMEAKS